MIAVWGKEGKSTIAANLACSLIKKDYVVGIIGASRLYGSIQHNFGVEIKKEKSLKRALDAKDDDEIKTKFTQHPKFDNLFILSLSNKDDCMTLEKITEEDGKRLILSTKDKFDYLIIDGTEIFNETLTLLALYYADKIVEVIKASLQGSIFRAAHSDLIENLKLMPKMISVVNLDKKYIDIKKAKQELKIELPIILPYVKEVEISENTGIPFYQKGATNRMEREYIKGIDIIAGRLEDNALAKESIQSKKRVFSRLFKKEVM